MIAPEGDGQSAQGEGQETGVAMLLAGQFLDFASGLADDYVVLDGGVVATASSAELLDRAAVTELLAV